MAHSGGSSSYAEDEDVTKRLKEDIHCGQTLFDKEEIGETDLTTREQHEIRLYLYFLMLQITVSLIVEIISYASAEYNWTLWAIGIAYFSNATKLYACIQRLVSLLY